MSLKLLGACEKLGNAPGRHSEPRLSILVVARGSIVPDRVDSKR